MLSEIIDLRLCFTFYSYNCSLKDFREIWKHLLSFEHQKVEQTERLQTNRSLHNHNANSENYCFDFLWWEHSNAQVFVNNCEKDGFLLSPRVPIFPLQPCTFIDILIQVGSFSGIFTSFIRLTCDQVMKCVASRRTRCLFKIDALQLLHLFTTVGLQKYYSTLSILFITILLP